jgi:hypothetical protein
MKVENFQSAMKLASKVSNPTSLTPLYRCVELGPDTLRACSEFGIIEIVIGETRFDKPVLIECEVFNNLFRSFTNNTDVYLTRASDRLLWETESGGGELITVTTDGQIPPLTHKSYPWTPPKTFAKALVRAQLACQSATVSVGMFGVVVVRTDGDLRLISCNSLSLSAVTLEDNGFPAEKITLRPPIPGILANILREYPESCMDITNEGIFVTNDYLTAHLAVGPPLEHDLLGISAKYSRKQSIVEIDVEALRAFLSRATLTKDKHLDELIEVTINDGALLLTQATNMVRVNEFLVTDGLDPSLTFAPVQFPKEQLLVPLDHVHAVVVDYLPQGILVLLGQDPDFEFIVCRR